MNENSASAICESISASAIASTPLATLCGGDAEQYPTACLAYAKVMESADSSVDRRQTAATILLHLLSLGDATKTLSKNDVADIKEVCGPLSAVTTPRHRDLAALAEQVVQVLSALRKTAPKKRGSLAAIRRGGGDATPEAKAAPSPLALAPLQSQNISAQIDEITKELEKLEAKKEELMAKREMLQGELARQ
uniref:Uncharacterized protein n=1 Tax=Sexangularia sp. CB-2014 TaxID=1486929 RepID=A0A7S1YFF5_9EUKA